MAPALLGLVPFGFVAGVAAIGSGLTPAQGIALSVLSFSGIAQLVACQLIAVHSLVIVTVAAAAVVSLRFLMYSAAIALQLAHLDRRWRALLSYLMTDQSYAASARRYSEPGPPARKHWHFLGAAADALRALAGVGDRRRVVAGAAVPESLRRSISPWCSPSSRSWCRRCARARISARRSSRRRWRSSLRACRIASRWWPPLIGGIAAGMAIEAWRKR